MSDQHHDNLHDDIIVEELQTATIESSPGSMLTNGTIMNSNEDGDIGAGGGVNTVNTDLDFFMADTHDFLNRLILKDDEGDVNMQDDSFGKMEEDVLGKVEIHSGLLPQPPVQQQQGQQQQQQQQEQELGVKTSIRDHILKKKQKFNCGFCTNDTPCLCFDAELDLSSLRD